MEKIRCPHCGAINQDVLPTDACWQCGQTLNGEAATTQAPAPVAPGASAGVFQAPQVVKKGERAPLTERVAARKAQRKAQRKPPIVWIVAVLLLLFLIVYFVLRGRG